MNDCTKEENIKLKLHIRYILIICIVVIIGLFVFACFLWPYNDDIAQKVSFAGTVSSIILSVLAIIVTLVGESKSEGVREKIDSSTLQLEDATIKIKNSSDELINKIKIIENFKNDVSQRFDGLEFLMGKDTNDSKTEFSSIEFTGVLKNFKYCINSYYGKEFILIAKFMYDSNNKSLERSKFQKTFKNFGYDISIVDVIFGMCLTFKPLFKIHEKEFFEALEEGIKKNKLEEQVEFLLSL